MSDSLWQPKQQQAVFRQLMNAMAYPGRVFELAGIPAGSAARAALASLVDGHVSLCDCHRLLAAADWLLLAADPAEPETADYLLCDGSRAPDWQPRLGTLTDPDASATLMIQVERLDGDGQPLHLSGPGIRDEQALCVEGLHPDWLSSRQRWVADFPLGVDLILADRSSIAAIPRTAQLVTG